MGEWSLARLVDFLLSLLRAFVGTRQVRQGDVKVGVDAQVAAQREEDNHEAAKAAVLAEEIRGLSDDELRARGDRWAGA